MNDIQQYLEKFTPLKCLPKGPTLTEEESIRWLIDEAFRASKQMIQTHHKDDIIRFIVLAQVLNQHGYQMQWVKFKGCVGATKKVTGDNPKTPILPILDATKEVVKYADKGSNGGFNRSDQPV